ncbi:hypothetical protein EXIGLDRAFT_731624 [Exidia glandulosa HHB12029]|uniref:F-box domain-containing protein n=1 Tax=Exidia glandulosa HHB12029 TaxID=1314781 RepID=A0A165KYM7_EXIGL|nr:hypothetical protein EXIGLDRAFT_731624 [Exidia glandulosa HHB12029]
MDAMSLAPQLREDVASFIRRTIDAALDNAGAKSATSPSSDAASTILNGVFAAFTDAVQSAIRDYSHAHNTKATVNSLPPEILGVVCSFLEQRDRLAVAQVCQQWRSNVLDNALLWTEHVVDHCGASALAHYKPLLSRTKQAPIKLDINFGEHTRTAATLSGARVSEFSELLYDHMAHVRQLALRISVDHDQQAVIAALRQPAPMLQTLHISVTKPSAGPSLPYDILTGGAPKLQSAVLQGVRLPRTAMSAFGALRELAIAPHDKLTTIDIERILHIAPDLNKLAIVARELAILNTEDDFAFHEGLRTLYIEGGAGRSEPDLTRILDVLASTPPSLREVGVASPTSTELASLLARASPCTSLSVVSRTGYSFSLKATPADKSAHIYRAWRLHLTHFATIHTAENLYNNLRELTLGEAVWSEALSADRLQLPRAPNLEKFTLVLAVEREYFDASASWGGNFTGIWFPRAAPNVETPPWECPALQTMRIMSSAPEGASVGRRQVALLLTHFMRAERLRRLEVLRVNLVPDTPGSEGLKLEERVREIVELPDSELEAIWPSLFPDLEWTGPLANTDNWTTR